MHISFAVLVECNMKQLVMLVSIDIKIEYNNFTADTDLCYFYFSFLSKLFISLFISLLKIWLCDNQPLIVK